MMHLQDNNLPSECVNSGEFSIDSGDTGAVDPIQALNDLLGFRDDILIAPTEDTKVLAWLDTKLAESEANNDQSMPPLTLQRLMLRRLTILCFQL